MDFGEALIELKKGRTLYREGWNAIKRELDVFLEYVAPRSTATMNYRSYLQMVYLIDWPFTVVGWLASQEDMLSDDWVIRK